MSLIPLWFEVANMTDHHACSDFDQVHIQRILHTYSKPDIATEARKLMHRFRKADVEALLDEAEGHS